MVVDKGPRRSGQSPKGGMINVALPAGPGFWREFIYIISDLVDIRENSWTVGNYFSCPYQRQT